MRGHNLRPIKSRMMIMNRMTMMNLKMIKEKILILN